MTGPFFVDTNVLVYAWDRSAPEKSERAHRWVRALWESRTGRLSTQVLNEFYSVATRRLPSPLTREEARMISESFLAWHPIPIDMLLLDRAWSLHAATQLSWWDTLIVAAAQRCAARYLLTEDLQEGQEFGGVTVVNPFRAEPEKLEPSLR
jgi:predicted nucleic acid-binding protein